MSVALSRSRIAGHKCTGAQAIQTKHLMGADNVLVVILSARNQSPGAMYGILFTDIVQLGIQFCS